MGKYGRQLRRPLARACVTGVGVSSGGGLCLLWLSWSRSVSSRKLDLFSLKSHVPCRPDVVECDLSFTSSILSSPEGFGPVFYGPQRVFFEKNAGSVARVCAGLSCLVRGCGRALSLIEIPQICQNVVRWTIA